MEAKEERGKEVERCKARGGIKAEANQSLSPTISHLARPIQPQNPTRSVFPRPTRGGPVSKLEKMTAKLANIVPRLRNVPMGAGMLTTTGFGEVHWTRKP